MKPKSPKPKPPKAPRGQPQNSVDAFLAGLDHPLKAEIEAVRAIIRGADKQIGEAIKWNAPSFLTQEHFATLKLHPPKAVQVVFHTGAKVKADARPLKIDDPSGLLKWAAPDRAVATFPGMKDIWAHKAALVALVRQWLAQTSPAQDATPSNFEKLWSTDRQVQHRAFVDVMQATAQPVDWAYDVWEELLQNLTHKDNHHRAIAVQVLCNLAKSDPKKRMLKGFDALFAVTRDERFVTARHCLQSLWKVGAAGPAQRKRLLAALERRFGECAPEKNCTLIRYDISQSLRDVYDATQEPGIRELALRLIETEEDLKYRKKYGTVWKKTG
ncbi:DUF1801 domain-containing protein [Stigmatella hybrida]|uniref:DUF1801 domain-containing protein n=1 Tax=Stigmatella hybrida TaxID=394097 RepID=UPI001CDB31DE|nr:DUF1801 domain-containing protein [Stigmatella hybrida]